MLRKQNNNEFSDRNIFNCTTKPDYALHYKTIKAIRSRRHPSIKFDLKPSPDLPVEQTINKKCGKDWMNRKESKGQADLETAILKLRKMEKLGLMDKDRDRSLNKQNYIGITQFCSAKRNIGLANSSPINTVHWREVYQWKDQPSYKKSCKYKQQVKYKKLLNAKARKVSVPVSLNHSFGNPSTTSEQPCSPQPQNKATLTQRFPSSAFQAILKQKIKEKRQQKKVVGRMSKGSTRLQQKKEDKQGVQVSPWDQHKEQLILSDHDIVTMRC